MDRIDPESRRRISSFGFRLGLILAALAIIALPGQRSAAELLQLLQSVMWFAAVWTGLCSIVLRESPLGPRLTHLDESLAFWIVFLVARICRSAINGA
jgi:hypothetical protein